MKLGLLGELLRTRLVIIDRFSLVVYGITKWLYFDVFVDGAKYLLWLRSDIILWFGPNIGNGDGLSLGRYCGKKYGSIIGGEFGIWLISKIGTDDGIWLGDRVYQTVGKIEGYLMRVLVGVLFGLSLRKYFESFIGSILGPVKGYVEGKIFGLVIGDTSGEPLERYFCWSDDVRSWKEPIKILGSREKSDEGGILVLALGDAYGASRDNSCHG